MELFATSCSPWCKGMPRSSALASLLPSGAFEAGRSYQPQKSESVKDQLPINREVQSTPALSRDPGLDHVRYALGLHAHVEFSCRGGQLRCVWWYLPSHVLTCCTQLWTSSRCSTKYPIAAAVSNREEPINLAANHSRTVTHGDGGTSPVVPLPTYKPAFVAGRRSGVWKQPRAKRNRESHVAI